MGPSRKKSKTSPPKVQDAPQTEVTATVSEGSTATPASSISRIEPTSESSENRDVQGDLPTPLKEQKKALKEDASSDKTLRSTKSWYGGTWPRLQKSTASTKVARESILADKPEKGVAAADLSRFEQRRKTSTSTADGRPPSMYLGKSKETSDITIGGTLDADAADPKDTQKPVPASAKHEPTAAPVETPTQAQPVESTESGPIDTQRPATASGWLGWLGRPDGYNSVSTNDEPQTVKEPELAEVAQENAEHHAGVEPAPLSSDEAAKPSTTPVTSTSWFGFWSSTAPTEPPKEELVPVKITEEASDTATTDASATETPAQPAAGSSWAFWSTADATKKGDDSPEAAKQPGELAVVGESSQDKPEPALTKAKEPEGKKNKTKKRGRPQSVDIDEPGRVATTVSQPNTSSTKATPTASPAPSKTAPPNILIPSVRGTYHMMENPSILQQLALILQLSQQRPVKHVHLSKDMPKIKKALAIGIHGLFPAPLLRTVIGQPTGTSIRFANHAAAALRRWADQHGCEGCEIEKVALEGEGKIAERVDNLWKLLLNWIDHVRSADFILVACHSQGVPVAMMLVAKLIEFGVVTSARIGVCAMAGVSLGPFADYKSRLFSGSAGELFEFADPESVVSKRYQDSLRVALAYGVRVTYCGSIDDQLISMESSICSTVSHPYIYRAVFIDGRIHTRYSIAHLVGFALKLRNLGVSDHGLIRELSAPLAGSLYTGEGHSRLYDDENVYDLAVEFALETTSVGEVQLDIQKYEIPSNANPYVLPWIMRGLLEEDFVKTELSTETAELLKQFDDWKPSTKVLKDVKYRLEAVRSKL
ncbi:hypothetical protein PVAG01_10746 [Phlyctema vagabunda]|uniref:YMC020W-like alpha/beta hydrolase domain-containing protein n=1 Tax=Phlyctema vagabunda TaxID=108571 RepID=A0ABR4P348_9HELO